MKKLILFFAVIAIFAIAFGAFSNALTGNLPGVATDDVPSGPDQDGTEHNHVYLAKETKAATCTNKGILTYTCECGDSYIEDIEKLPHTEVVTANVAPTCTKKGHINYACSVCENGIRVVYIDALGHDFSSNDGCGNGATYYCFNCGEYSDIAVPHVGDSNNDGKCDYCGIVISSSGGSSSSGTHTHSYTVTKSPTCTETGTKKCSCGATLTIPATGHDRQDSGCVGTVYCGECGVTLATQGSHGSIVNGVCIVCGHNV